MIQKIRLGVQYVGTSYAGWQLQPDCQTVQGTLERALERVLQSPIRIHGASRTDAGVHAFGQVAHFETDSDLPEERLRSALNHFLPWDLQVMSADRVGSEFHARESAVSKEYRYRIYRGEVMPPCVHPFGLLVRGPLDLDEMRHASERFLGTHDFASFRSVGSSAETTIRTVLRSEWSEQGPEAVYRIEADGFLYKMVRTIVGTLLEVGRGKRDETSVRSLIEASDRSRAGPVAPARGLHLWSVQYRPLAQECNRVSTGPDCGARPDVV